MNDIIGTRTLKAVDLLLCNSREMQEKMQEQMPAKQRSGIGYCKEWCTVRVCGPRRSGHTTAINALVEMFGGDNVIVISPTMAMSEFITKDAKHKASPNCLDRARGLADIKAVIVDVASCISKKKLDKIYRVCSPYCGDTSPFFFILME